MLPSSQILERARDRSGYKQYKRDGETTRNNVRDSRLGVGAYRGRYNGL